MENASSNAHPPELHVRYAVGKIQGHGSYGAVYTAIDRHDGSKVALKRVRDVFATAEDALRTLRELSILRQCSHPCVVGLLTVLQPRAGTEHSFNELWLVMDHLRWDLGRLLATKVARWSMAHVGRIFTQLLCGLAYLHSAQIVHRDLKPANVLVSSRADVKICDFGLSRTIGSKQSDWNEATTCATSAPSLEPPKCVAQTKRPGLLRRTLTQHVVTRWYRAPELLLLENNYSAAIDMWSAGCILGELLWSLEPSVLGQTAGADRSSHARAMFPGGSAYPLSGDSLALNSMDTADVEEALLTSLSDPSHQLHCIFSVIGTPSDAEIAGLSSSTMRHVLAQLQPLRPVMQSTKFPGTAVSWPQALHLLSELLSFNPALRPSAMNALESPLVKRVFPRHGYDASKKPELLCQFGDGELHMEFEDQPRELGPLRKLLLTEVSLSRRTGAPGHDNINAGHGLEPEVERVSAHKQRSWADVAKQQCSSQAAVACATGVSTPPSYPPSTSRFFMAGMLADTADKEMQIKKVKASGATQPVKAFPHVDRS